MFTLSQLTEILGWASIINIAYLTLASLFVILAKDKLTTIHNKLFGMQGQDLTFKYFDFLSFYKVATLVFFVAPYLALKIIGY